MGLNIKVSSIHWGSWNISPARKGGLRYVELRNHLKVSGSQEINLMQVVTIYCIDIFTKYYNVKYHSNLPYYARTAYRRDKVYGKTLTSVFGIRNLHKSAAFKVSKTTY